MGVLKGLDMTKEAYNHFRRLYPVEELCISANDSETADWLNTLSDSNLKWRWTETSISFGENYNRAVDMASKEKVVLYHNDMIPAPGFLEMLDRNVDPMTVLGYTTIEPPVFKDHERPGKIIQDFGADFQNFRQHEFERFSLKSTSGEEPMSSAPTEKLTPGVFFFLSCFKSTFEEIGGLDGETFTPVFCEDDDFILRLLHHGCTLHTTNMAQVYHFVSRTIRFSDVPITEWNSSSAAVEIRSIRNFIRKWGKKYNGYENQRANVVDIGYRVRNATSQFVELLEPYARNLQMDTDTDEYVRSEQPKTVVNLKEKFVSTLTNSVVVDIDALTLVPHTFNVLTELPRILTHVVLPGQFKYGPFTVTVNTPIVNLADTLIVHTRK